MARTTIFRWYAPSRGRCSNPIPPSFSAVWRSRYSNASSPTAMAGCPPAVPPELIRQGRAVLNELAVEAGRDPASITVLAYIAPAERTVLQALTEAGADAAGGGFWGCAR